MGEPGGRWVGGDFAGVCCSGCVVTTDGVLHHLFPARLDRRRWVDDSIFHLLIFSDGALAEKLVGPLLSPW